MVFHFDVKSLQRHVDKRIRVLTVDVELPPVLQRTVVNQRRAGSAGQDLAAVFHSRHKRHGARRRVSVRTRLQHKFTPTTALGICVSTHKDFLR